MTFRQTLTIFMATTAWICGHADTKIEPPVPNTQRANVREAFVFSSTAKIESELRWRNSDFNGKQPGMATLNQVTLAIPGSIPALLPFADVNLYTQNNDTDSSSANNYMNHLMVEARLGTKYQLNPSSCYPLTLAVSRTLHSWPGGENWAWSGTSITPLAKIKPLRGTDIEINWHGFNLLYNIAEKTQKEVISGTAQGKNWGNYFEISSPKLLVEDHYSFAVKTTRWNNINAGYEGALIYKFSPIVHGSITAYASKPSVSSKYKKGVTGGIQLTHNTHSQARQSS